MFTDETMQAFADAVASATTTGDTTTYDLARPAAAIGDIRTPLIAMLPRHPASADDRLMGPFPGIGMSTEVQHTEDTPATILATLTAQLKMTEERWVLSASEHLQTPPCPVISPAPSASVNSRMLYVAVTAVNRWGQATASPVRCLSMPTRPSQIGVQIFTVPYATSYRIYAGWSPDDLHAQDTPTPLLQPRYNSDFYLAGSDRAVLSGDVEGPFVRVTLPRITTSGPPPPSAPNPATFAGAAGEPLMFDGLIAQAGIVRQPEDAAGILVLMDIDALLSSMPTDADLLVAHPLTVRRIRDLSKRERKYEHPRSKVIIPIIVDRYCPVHTLMALSLQCVHLVVADDYHATYTPHQQYIASVSERLQVADRAHVAVLRGITPA